MNDTVIRHLRHKIVLVSTVAVFVSLAALIFAINYAHYLQVDASLRTAMSEIARNAATNNANRVMRNDRKSAHTQYASRFFSVIVASDGDMFVKAKGNNDLSNEYACDLAQSALDSGKSEGLLDDFKYAIEKTDDQTRILFLDCTTDLQSLHQLLLISLAVGGCAFIVASLFALRFSGLAVRPLEESARKQKQFVADAGHELKTPLSVIATNMDILELDLAEQPEELEWIDSTNRQVSNMKRLVNDLIVLSKMEEQETDLVLAEVSLSDLAFECVLTFDQLAHSQGKELVATIDEGVRVTADEPSVRQLMQILIDNAIKYATGDAIRIEVGKEGRNAVFLTRNDWDHGMDPKELSSLFDRFVRGEQSRDRSGGSSGYGLGLSIARAIAEKNNAKLEAFEEDGKIVFRATFSR